MKKGLVITGVAIVALAVGWYLLKPKSRESFTAKDFDMATVTKGSVAHVVTASGKIQPINKVSVGTQVSGIIEQVLVDYNDEVKEDQVLARLDTSVLQENLNDAKARLDLAISKKKISDLNYERLNKLYKDKLISKANLEEAEIDLETAKANVLSSQADYNKAERNFGYATITSPVSGTVISKEVEQGQTVAASLSTPTLFTIAEDLTKMQIEANIAEADIGVIKSDMPVSFTVDAYPNDKFNGKVQQIRLSPTEESNVVMYTVVIEVDNSSRKLLPGMTASVSIEVERAEDVPLLPAMVLQFKPSAALRKTTDEVPNPDMMKNEDVVYQFKNGRLKPIVITKGISDMANIEIKAGLEEGDQVILEASSGKRRGRK
ncbi:MAG: efflux RND transporter periplasmic adaptor subunit [Alphaproteobacteria bacterium]|nr:efflux RND transporter periplasmic adaptor subunit [Alphaproteobacteria bacterium]